LRFEPLAGRHAAALSDALLDPEVYRFITGPRPVTTEDLANEFHRVTQPPATGRDGQRWWNVAVFSADTGQGLGRLEATIFEWRAEVAYLFGAMHWGQGYAQEAMHWLHDRLAEDSVATELWATVAPQNERSIRLLTRLGYAPVAAGWPKLYSYDDGDLIFQREIR
jgi:RimJ/RimL family protein N-acetyltransferase